jgi:hypothetical protein
MTIPLRGPATRLRPAVHLTRAVFAAAAAASGKHGDKASAESLARKFWGDDEPTRLILRGAVSPASISSSGAIARSTARRREQTGWRRWKKPSRERTISTPSNRMGSVR